MKQLRGFVHAVRLGSISRASQRMGLSQPSVSMHIQSLERALDAVLLERVGPKISLTPDGEALMKLAGPLVDRFEALPRDFDSRRAEVDEGELAIASGESTLLYLLPTRLREFRRRYPQVRLDIQNVTGRDGLSLLREDAVDLAVGSMIEVPDDMVFQPIVRFRPMLITPLNHRLAAREELSFEDIAEYGLILPPRHLATWRVVDVIFRQHGLTPKIALEAGGWEVVKKYVAMGMGISIVTGICLTGEEPLHSRPLDRWFPWRQYGIVTRRGRFLSPQARAFIELMDPVTVAAEVFAAEEMDEVQMGLPLRS